MSEGKKPYEAPSLIRREAGKKYLEWMTRNLESDSQKPRGGAAQEKRKPDYVAVVDIGRKFVEVSDNFCQLVGYEREELLGMRCDDLTAPNTVDVPKLFRLLERLGYMHGLYMLVSRGGTRIVVRYDSWLRGDSLIEGHMELVGAGY